MKNIDPHPIYLVLFFLISCSDPKLEQATKASGFESSSKEKHNYTLQLDSLINNKSLQIDSLNYTDENGLKQGKWITKKYNGHVLEIKNYKNDTLHGLCQKLDGNPIDEYYNMGKRNGFKSIYYERPKNIFLISYYEEDSLIWTGFPAANEPLLIPIKPFVIYKDTFFIQAPFEDGTIWYEGHFRLSSKGENDIEATIPFGLHKVYFRNGSLKGVVDYNNSTIQEFDTLGQELYFTNLKNMKLHGQYAWARFK